ncbi:tetratricopeptide repeat protein [Namhaeicola litoreus]|uniref:Tetratricopeptide repeat protein n=1 Tax=Namhaeicola litoreus TaxID=1052145 RepID=A0ABW3XYA4_9FLAO
MRNIFFIFFLSFSTFLFSQKPEQAYRYYMKGEYEQAAMLYKALHEKNRIQREYFKKLITCQQQLGDYDEAEKIILNQLIEFPMLTYLDVELGYNFELQGKFEEAEKYYQSAIQSIEINPNQVYNIGYSFTENHKLEYALQSYEIAKRKNPKLVTQIQEAQIYGEQGEFDKMFASYLNLVDFNEEYVDTVKRYLAQYISDDPSDKNNILFKKQLLLRAQNNPKNSYNLLLSWLFVQQKDYNKAIVQEISIYNRDKSNIEKIYELGLISMENKDFESAKKAFYFILNQDNSDEVILNIQNNLLSIQIQESKPSDYSSVDKNFQEIFIQYGKTGRTIPLQINYADFLAFQLNKPDEAIKLLKEAIPDALSELQKGMIKIKLGDILVFDNQFNQALILYSQVQNDLKNSNLAQTARFKVAQTSYFKGDFEWAKDQLSVLKSSTSQLIANDALDLYLLILNNIDKDSLKTPLELYAKSQLYSFQKKNDIAIKTLDTITQNYKGSLIEDDALKFQAELFTSENIADRAESNYLKIESFYPDSILIDQVLYQLAELYLNHLSEPDKARIYFEKIIFNYPSSIYLVDARKQYRKLRGDILN